MRELLIAPQIDSFETFAEFAAGFSVGAEDLILTNEYIYDPVSYTHLDVYKRQLYPRTRMGRTSGSGRLRRHLHQGGK